MPLLWLSTAFILGILAASGLHLPWIAWLSCAGFSVLVAFLEHRFLTPRTRYRSLRKVVPVPLGLVLALFFLGALRWQVGQSTFTARDLAFYNDQGSTRLTAEVVSAPDRRDTSTLLTVQVRELTPEEGEPIPVRGLALVRLPPGALFRYGDRLAIDGSPQTPPEDESFSYREYLARQGIFTYLNGPQVFLAGRGRASPFWTFTYALRERAYTLVNRFYPMPESALLSGILLGLDQDLPEPLAQAFRDTGTAHVIAISGFNMSILAALFIGLFGRFLPRGWAALAAILALAFYTLLVGGNPAVVRAAVMGVVGVFGQLIGRRQAGMNTLLFTAALMALFNPFLPWDVSFQLSFTATLGLILYGNVIEAAFDRWSRRHLSRDWARRIAGPVTEFGLLTLAAQATTLPVTVYHFQRLSLSTLLANPLVLPPQPLLMVMGGLSVLAGLVFAPLGQLLAWITWPLAAYTNRVVDLLGHIPGGVLVLNEIPLWLPLAMYAALFLFTLAPRSRLPLAKLARPAVALAGAALLSGFAWRCVFALPDGNFHLTLAGVDGGPAVLVQAPGGETALLGGSASARQLSDLLGRTLSPADRALDAVLLTRTDADALTGLPVVLSRFPPEHAWWALDPPALSRVTQVEDSLRENGVEPSVLEIGQTAQLGNSVRLTVLAQAKDGAAVLLEMGDLRALVPGGVPPEELAILEGIHLLVLGEADLKNAPPEAWDQVGAQTVAVVGSDLPEHWIDLSEAGWIEVVSDGKKWTLRTGK